MLATARRLERKETEQGFAAAAQAWHDEFQAATRFNSRFPYKQIGLLIGIFHSFALLILSLFMRLLRKPRPSRLHQLLAREWFCLPDVALQKAFELGALLDNDFQGCGLDLGCGFGYTGQVLIDLAGVSSLHGVDRWWGAGPSSLQRGYASFVAADVQALPYRDATFDYVLSICVIEHIPDLSRFLAEAARVVKPGGRLIFTTPSPALRDAVIQSRLFEALGLHEQARLARLYRDYQAMHHHYLDAGQWQTELAKHGFGKVGVRPFLTSRQFLWIDAINIFHNQHLKKCYFRQNLFNFFNSSGRRRRFCQWVTEPIIAVLASAPPDSSPPTHFLVSCEKE
jgi:SAM-dependent methyltransferase